MLLSDGGWAGVIRRLDGARARLGFSLLHVVQESRLSMLSSWRGPGLLGGGPEYPKVQDPRGRKLKLAGQTWNWHTSAGLAWEGPARGCEH